MIDTLFYIFAIIALSAAIGVITFKNSVYAVFSLILVFFSTAVIWLLMRAEFLAISLILVYVGAVMVLFLFVVMMLDVDFSALMTRFSRWVPIAIGTAVLFALAIFKVLHLSRLNVISNEVADYSNVMVLV
jgi:NADH-quinone oxidoreductase subunit J